MAHVAVLLRVHLTVQMPKTRLVHDQAAYNYQSMSSYPVRGHNYLSSCCS